MKYDLNKLKSALWHFYNITGMTVTLLDKNFQGIFYQVTAKGNDLCFLVQSTEEGKKRCLASDCKLFTQCTKTREAVAHRCHAGLSDAIVPICKDREIIGYVLFGQAIAEQNPGQGLETVKRNLGDLPLESEKLEQALSTLNPITPEKFSSAVEVVRMLTKYILWEDLIQEETPQENFEKIIKYIEMHLCEELTVADICMSFHVSKNTLYRFFSERFGCGIKEYITTRRIAQAEHLLRTTDLPVYEICEKAGIPNYSYFSAFFKREKKITPLQYRKQWQSVKEKDSHD